MADLPQDPAPLAAPAPAEPSRAGGSRWAGAATVVAAALIALIPHLSVLLGRAELYYDDHRRFSVPLGTVAAQAVCRGELPVWNPYLGLGAPLMADPTSLALHPGLLLACVLPPSHALGLLFVLHLGVLAAGMAALLRALAVPAGLAVGAAAAVALCGPAPSLLTPGPYVMTLAWFPWVVLAAWRLGQGGRIPAAVGLGVALALAVLGGDVPGALCQALVAVVVWICAGGRWRSPGWLLAAGGLALLLGAVSWAPLAWYLGRSVRAAGLSAAESGRWSLHPAELIGLLVPHPTGLPLPENTFWPFGWVKQPRLFIHSYYSSALLAVAGCWGAWVFRRERLVRGLMLAALALLLFASGSTTPLWRVIGPLFTFLRYPSKLAPYALLMLVVVGALALGRRLDTRCGPRVTGAAAALAALGALFLPFVQQALARAAGAPPEQIVMAASQLRAGAATVAVLAALACAVLWLGPRVPLLRRHAATLLGAIVIADAAVAGTSLWWTAPAPLVTPRPAWLSQPLGGPRVIRAGELDRAHVHRDEIGYLRDVLRHERLLQPNTNINFRAGVLEGYGLGLGDLSQGLARLYQEDPVRLAEITGTDFMLVPAHPPQPWIDQALIRGRIQVVTSLPTEAALVLRPVAGMPRAYTTTQYTLRAAAEELDRLLAGDFLAGPVLREGERLEGGRRRQGPVTLPPPASGDREPAAPVAWSPSAQRFQIDRPEPSLLVVTDAFAEGWHAAVDGVPVPIYRANVVARAVPVPAGPHTVTLWFDVPLFRWAARAPLLGLALALGAILFHLRRARQAE